MSEQQREEILQAEAAIQQLVKEISQYSIQAHQTQQAADALNQALKTMDDLKAQIGSLAQEAGKSLEFRIDQLVSKSETASQSLSLCADREAQEVARLASLIGELEMMPDKLQAAAPDFKTIIEAIDLNLVDKNRILLAELARERRAELEQWVQGLRDIKNKVNDVDRRLEKVSDSLGSLFAKLEDISKRHGEIGLFIEDFRNTMKFYLDSAGDRLYLVEKSMERIRSTQTRNLVILGIGLLMNTVLAGIMIYLMLGQH